MVRSELARARPAHPTSQDSRQPNTRKEARSRRGKRRAARAASRSTAQLVWTELEQAFFAAAPTEADPAPVEPDRFDDLSPPTAGDAGGGGVRRAVAAVAARLRSLLS